MNNNTKQDHNIESKYDTENSPAEYISDKSEYNTCNICRKSMYITQSHYINKKDTNAPIICYNCVDAPRYHDLIGAYILHFNTPSKLNNCWQYFSNIGKVLNYQKIKPI